MTENKQHYHPDLLWPFQDYSITNSVALLKKLSDLQNLEHQNPYFFDYPFNNLFTYKFV